MKSKSKGIVSWPKTERPRERLLAEGVENLTEAELRAIILRVGQGTFTAGVRGQNASDFARKLLLCSSPWSAAGSIPRCLRQSWGGWSSKLKYPISNTWIEMRGIEGENGWCRLIE